jgi:hypothetical protein
MRAWPISPSVKNMISLPVSERGHCFRSFSLPDVQCDMVGSKGFCAKIIAAHEVAISDDLFSNVAVGDFLDLHLRFLPGTRAPNSLETSTLRVDQPGSLV